MGQNDQTRAGDASAPDSIPVPTGTRDVLPEEMEELRAISSSAMEVFARAGYGEVATPALEYEETMRISATDISDSVYRVPDKDGRVLTLRFDSTVPIARLAATRYRNVDPPLRFCYMQHVYRAVEPGRAEPRQFLQVGMELLGLDAPEGDAEGISLLHDLLEAVGLKDFKIAVGDVGLFNQRIADAGLSGEIADSVLHELHTRDLVGFRRELAATEMSDSERSTLERLALARGDRALLEREGASRLLELDRLLAPLGVTDAVIYDLGLVRPLNYYTGFVVEVYAPGSGVVIGGGGRYDNLVSRFGRDLDAFGFSLNMERLHLALLAQNEAVR